MKEARRQISIIGKAHESEVIEGLYNYGKDLDHESVAKEAEALVGEVRAGKRDEFYEFLLEFDLNSSEGKALFCLAEALLRIKDLATRKQLIADKLGGEDWQGHIGKSESSFVNFSSWALNFSSSVVNIGANSKNVVIRKLTKLYRKTGKLVIHQAVVKAVEILSVRFVYAETIDKALNQASKDKRYRYSFDMLGEGARNLAQSEIYFEQYLGAIKNIAKKGIASNSFIDNPSISVKLSSLHPHFYEHKREIVFPYLLDKLKILVREAEGANIALTIDAEEAHRLDLTLDLFAEVFKDPEFRNYKAFGIAVQAYQKRAFYVIDFLASLAKQADKKIFVRLVKGAYFDSEIKHAQMGGFADYPIFTEKHHTDLSYLSCAKKLLSHSKYIYPQFATHNIYTIIAVKHLAVGGDYEFQRLQGMGEEVYDLILKDSKQSCRVYAPIGNKETLLAYLMRRIIENSANNSFVYQIYDQNFKVRDLCKNPYELAKKNKFAANGKIVLPEDIFGATRKNSKGLDINDQEVISKFGKIFSLNADYKVGSLVAGEEVFSVKKKVVSPLDGKIVGEQYFASQGDLNRAFDAAQDIKKIWHDVEVKKRSRFLSKLAALLEDNSDVLVRLLIEEAGKSYGDALDELREAIDMCRYYASLALKVMIEQELSGYVGESNKMSWQPRGIFVAVSPWNFPLAIFVGQISAALVTGNVVIAKAAPQTGLIANLVGKLLLSTGLPVGVFQLLLGDEKIGKSVVSNPKVAGVVFTGSTKAAKEINYLVHKYNDALVPIIAETGGQNAMIVDSSALLEQVVDDVITSAFLSSGQRCSALRILFIQQEIADELIEMLVGAVELLTIGDTRDIKTDIGPVIDKEAKQNLQKYISKVKKKAKSYLSVSVPKLGNYIAPQIIEIANFKDLPKQEVFGPILHIMRYQRNGLQEVINYINSTGYGLTFGLHTRLDSMIEYCNQNIKAGNIYVNRNMTGAVVGVQPFGGEGKSGTGFKAGGPNYLFRFLKEQTITINTVATGGNPELYKI